MEGRWSNEALQAMETHLGLLKKVSNQGGVTGRPAQLSGLCEQDLGPQLDLNSNVPLPFGWEQFLDLKTGHVYYVDWMNCRRSYADPRNFVSEHDNLEELDVSECMSDADNCCVSSTHGNRRIHTNKLATFPMLQEDWDLLETRGWVASECDNHSTITNEVNPSNLTRSSSFVEMEGVFKCESTIVD